MVGFAGCCGSMDGVHVLLEQVTHRLKQYHDGPKLKQSARSFNVITNHRRRMLSSTRGHPSRWNDKTLFLCDYNAVCIHKGEVLQDNEFELHAYDSNGNVIVERYNGACLITDNGYLHIPSNIPPFTDSNSLRELRWSQWLESFRKDVECTFGILKGRFRILKTGIRVRGLDKVDNIFLTCCALHNMLLERDGLDEYWTGIGGQFDDADMVRESRPFAQERLLNPQHYHNHDVSGMGNGSDISSEQTGEIDVDLVLQQLNNPNPNPKHIKTYTRTAFRRKLVDHFHIKFMRKEIMWPVCNKT